MPQELNTAAGIINWYMLRKFFASIFISAYTWDNREFSPLHNKKVNNEGITKFKLQKQDLHCLGDKNMFTRL